MSSKRRLRRIVAKARAQGCTRKQPYANEAAAWVHAHAALRRGVTGLHVYRCTFGDHYHLGHRREEILP